MMSELPIVVTNTSSIEYKKYALTQMSISTSIIASWQLEISLTLHIECIGLASSSVTIPIEVRPEVHM
jgi:hypothetical protein